MAKAKFNLTDLLNSRSKEPEEESVAGQQNNAPLQKEENEIVNIDVYDLIPSKDNFYHVDDELKRSIELVGILQPLLVSRPENGKYRVIAGHRRRLAALSLVEEGKEEMRFVPCIFKKADVRDRLALIMANRFRDKTDWEKMMEAIQTEELAKELKKEYSLNGRTREILAEITGTTEAQLGRYKSIYNNLSARLMKDFKENIINVSVAVELCSMSAEGQEKAADRVEEVGILTLMEAREMKQQEESRKDIPGQMSFPDNILPDAIGKSEEEHDKEEETSTEGAGEVLERKQEDFTDQTEPEEYEDHQPEPDQKTAKKLQERQQEEKAQQLPGEAEKRVHKITLEASKYNEIADKILTFYLLKNDGYRVGDTVVMQEYIAGRMTGREIVIEITYVWENWMGLEEDYCIIGFAVELRRRR